MTPEELRELQLRELWLRRVESSTYFSEPMSSSAQLRTNVNFESLANFSQNGSRIVPLGPRMALRYREVSAEQEGQLFLATGGGVEILTSAGNTQAPMPAVLSGEEPVVILADERSLEVRLHNRSDQRVANAVRNLREARQSEDESTRRMRQQDQARIGEDAPNLWRDLSHIAHELGSIANHLTSESEREVWAQAAGTLAGLAQEASQALEDIASLPNLPEQLLEAASIALDLLTSGQLFDILIENPEAVARLIMQNGLAVTGVSGVYAEAAAAVREFTDLNFSSAQAHLTRAALKVLGIIFLVRGLIRTAVRLPTIIRRTVRNLDELIESLAARRRKRGGNNDATATPIESETVSPGASPRPHERPSTTQGSSATFTPDQQAQMSQWGTSTRLFFNRHSRKLSPDPETIDEIGRLLRSTSARDRTPISRRAAAGELATADNLLNNPRVMRLRALRPSNEAGARTADFDVTFTDGTSLRVEVTTNTGAPRGVRDMPRSDTARLDRQADGTTTVRPETSGRVVGARRSYSRSRTAALIREKILHGQINPDNPGVLVVQIPHGPPNVGDLLSTVQIRNINNLVQRNNHVREVLLLSWHNGSRRFTRVGGSQSGMRLEQ